MAIETLRTTLHTTDGLRLDADVCVPPGAAAGVVVCHPHPLYGGDRFNPVVDAVFRACASAGVAALRFDFRGVNASEGEHGGGGPERLDALAAIEHLGSLVGAPLWLAGYSFGAAVALDVVHDDLAGWLAVAPPLAMMPGPRAAADDHRPVHLLVAGHDQFSPPAPTAEATASWAATHTTVVARADHFFAGDLTTVAQWTLESIRPPR